MVQHPQVLMIADKDAMNRSLHQRCHILLTLQSLKRVC